MENDELVRRASYLATKLAEDLGLPFGIADELWTKAFWACNELLRQARDHSDEVVTAVLETVVDGREGDDFFRAARLVIDGFEKVTPLEPGERAILGELLAARMCAAVVVPASRSALQRCCTSCHSKQASRKLGTTERPSVTRNSRSL